MSRLDALFQVAYGNQLDMNKMIPSDQDAGIAFIGRRSTGQGLAGFVEALDGIVPFSPGSMTVALGGSYLLSSFVQQRPYYTGQNVAVLNPLDEHMPLSLRLYYSMCIRHNAFRYTAFGREANRTLGSIDLPDEVPSWVEEAPIPTYDGLAKSASTPHRLSPTENWPAFALGDLFTIKKGKRLTKADRIPGGTRFIGASAKNNGVTDLNDVAPNASQGCLTVPYNGSVGWAFYQDRPFFACDDVNILEPKVEMSKWTLLFLCGVIRHERSRYSYGFKWTLERMRATTVRLPSLGDGSPDYQYMEKVMRGLPFSAALNQPRRTGLQALQPVQR